MPEIIAPVFLDIQVPAKADYDLEFTVTDEDGDVINISAETLTMVVYRRRTDVEPLLEKTNAPNEHSIPTEGKTKFRFVVADSDWMERSEELALYEVWREYDGGDRRFPWFRGGILFTAVRGTGTL